MLWQVHQYTEWLIRWTKDFSRSIDYLETRKDIDTTKLGFYGQSWGGDIGWNYPGSGRSSRNRILLNGGLNAAQQSIIQKPMQLIMCPDKNPGFNVKR